MSEVGQHPDEKRFEDHIEKHLNAIGFKSIDYNNYDRELCLIPDEVLSFIQDSQPDEYQKLTEQFSGNTDDTILKKLSESIGKNGLIYALRNRLSSRGVHLNMFVRQPKSSLNPEHIDSFNKNRFTLVILSDLFKKQIEINSEGGGQPNIGREELMNFSLYIPPHDEQTQIANSLTYKLSKNDLLIYSEGKRSKLLSEYRQSLISSVVTGKVRVTEDMI